MYRFEQLPPLPPSLSQRPGRVPLGARDSERGLVVRHVGRNRDTLRDSWLLEHHDALIPFEVGERFTNEPAGTTIVLSLESFGFSMTAAQRIGVGRYTFASADEERSLGEFAVEGVLFSWAHDHSRTDITVRMKAFGQSWTLRDFVHDRGDIL